MQFEGAVVREQGQTFGVLVVRPVVLNDSAKQAEMRGFGARSWGAMPIVLAAQDSRGLFTNSGRRDIVKFLANVDPSRIPWKRWTV